MENILEIGTFTGEFTNFLSKVFPNSLITSIDLETGNKLFRETYNRKKEKELNKFLEIKEQKY